MSEEWKVMTDADKHTHQAQADRAREKYDKDMKAYKEKVAKQEGAHSNDKGDSVLGKKKQKESAKPSKVEKEVAKAPAGKAKAEEKKGKGGKAAAPAKPAAKQTKPKKVAAGEEVNAEEKKTVEKPKTKTTPAQ
jgi:hypothetical protein